MEFKTEIKPRRVKIHRSWRPFQARDFHSLMYPVMFLCFILGHFPYKLTSSTVIFSKVRLICSTFAIALYVVYFFIILYQIDISHILDYDTVPGILQGNFFIILGGIINVATYAMTRTRLQLLQCLLDISTRLPPENFNNLAKIIHTKDVLGFVFLLLQTPNVYNPDNIYGTLCKCFVLYTTMVVFTMDMLYMDCVCVVKACFARTNENLMNLKEVLTKDEPHLLRRVYHEQRNPLLLMEIKALKKQHLMISDVVQLLNITFSLQIMATTVMTFAEVTFGLYFYILQNSIGIQGTNVKKEIWYLYFITAVTYYTVKLIVMVWACETGKDKATEIGATIHEVLSSTTDKQIKDELHLFSLQVLHRDNTFSAKGLTMDATLLTTIAGSTTTYLLILMQFLLAVQPCKQTSVQL